MISTLALRPFADLERLHRDLFTPPRRPQLPSVKASTTETDEAYLIEFEVPGFTRAQLNIEVHDGSLKVHSVTPETSDEEEPAQLPRFRFARAFTLPKDVEPSDISAKLEAGLLTITLKKTAPPAARSITIE